VNGTHADTGASTNESTSARTGEVQGWEILVTAMKNTAMKNT
jgi:hypothetical protein